MRITYAFECGMYNVSLVGSLDGLSLFLLVRKTNDLLFNFSSLFPILYNRIQSLTWIVNDLRYKKSSLL